MKNNELSILIIATIILTIIQIWLSKKKVGGRDYLSLLYAVSFQSHMHALVFYPPTASCWDRTTIRQQPLFFLVFGFS